MVLSWFDAREILGRKSPAKSSPAWPQNLRAFDAAFLQRPPAYPPKSKDGKGMLMGRLADHFIAQQPATRLFDALVVTFQVSEVDKYSWQISAPAFAAWLAAQGETPSTHIRSWIDAVGVPGAGVPDATPKPKQRGKAQDETIIQEIKKQGFDPLALPKNPPGKRGVKAAIRAAVKGNILFIGTTVFDDAWERLRKCGDIVD